MDKIYIWLEMKNKLYKKYYKFIMLEKKRKVIVTHCEVYNYGVNRFGSRGNIEVFLILSNPKYSITTRSKPIPPPA